MKILTILLFVLSACSSDKIPQPEPHKGITIGNTNFVKSPVLNYLKYLGNKTKQQKSDKPVG